jgi:RHS repeat-associated protein
MQLGYSYDAVYYKFTGKERDAESGLDNFGARYNASTMGRFMTPDPKMPSLKHLANPQKWNKYAYVLNNPLALVDPDGREEVTVTIRAYIPQQSFRSPPVIGPTWKGDGPAGHGREATSYRVQATVKIETDQSVRKSSNPVVSVAGDTTGSSVNWYGLGTQTGRSNVSAAVSGPMIRMGTLSFRLRFLVQTPSLLEHRPKQVRSRLPFLKRQIRLQPLEQLRLTQIGRDMPAHSLEAPASSSKKVDPRMTLPSISFSGKVRAWPVLQDS